MVYLLKMVIFDGYVKEPDGIMRRSWVIFGDQQWNKNHMDSMGIAPSTKMVMKMKFFR